MSDDRQTGIDIATLKLLIEHFPIGKGLRYSPDAHLAIVFDTIVVAYCVNEHYIYSRNAIKTDASGNPLAVLVEEGGTEVAADKILQLNLLVPDTSDLEGTLDYDRRSLIGRSSQFLEGNVITLIAGAGVNGAATLTTHVVQQLILAEGPYTHSKMILLRPELDSLSAADRLHKSRGKASVPVELHFKKGEAPYPCILSDFSEAAVGLHVRDHQGSMPAIEKDDAVIIVINLGEGAKAFTIKGRVVRCAADSCVIHLEQLLKGHEFARLTLLDSLELKTGLLNFQA